jgi:hypothetical protein
MIIAQIYSFSAYFGKFPKAFTNYLEIKNTLIKTLDCLKNEQSYLATQNF